MHVPKMTDIPMNDRRAVEVLAINCLGNVPSAQHVGAGTMAAQLHDVITANISARIWRTKLEWLFKWIIISSTLELARSGVPYDISFPRISVSSIKSVFNAGLHSALPAGHAL